MGSLEARGVSEGDRALAEDFVVFLECCEVIDLLSVFAPSDGLRIFGGSPVFRSLIEPSLVDPFSTAMKNLAFSLRA
jgi:hypothetical protein